MEKDLSRINTYGELKRLLPATGKGRVPGIQQLKKKGNILLRRRTVTGTIEIYDNGFFSFEEYGCTTVYGVDRCDWAENYGGRKGEKGDFDMYAWDLILESAASARLDHNANYREEYRGEIPLDAADWENNSTFSVQPEYEIREEEELYAEWKKLKIKKMKAAMERPTARQREIAMMYFRDNMTQVEISKVIGKDQSYVSRTIKRYLEKVNEEI